MTIFARIEPDLTGVFHLTGASELPKGEGPVDIEGASIGEVIEKFAQELGTQEEIIPVKPLPSLDILK